MLFSTHAPLSPASQAPRGSLVAVTEIPGTIMDLLRATAVIVALMTALAGCTPSRQNDPGVVREQIDIHERLSEAISRDGFGHELRSLRDGPEHFDVIGIKISLDSLKGRHLSLEKLMMDIGRICSHPGYAHLPIRILIVTGDEDDRRYLQAILATHVKGRGNVALVTAAELRNEIIITVRHPGQGGG